MKYRVTQIIISNFKLQFWPLVDKANMWLKGGSFFLFLKIVNKQLKNVNKFSKIEKKPTVQGVKVRLADSVFLNSTATTCHNS